MTFRGKLTAYGMSLVLLLGVPFLLIEIQRPWQELDSLLERTEALLGGVAPGFDVNDLVVMNDFAADTIAEFYADEDAIHNESRAVRQARGAAFLHCVAGVAQETGRNEFTEAEFERWVAYWQKRFEDDRKAYAIFRYYWRLLRNARENARLSGFAVCNVYLMLDRPREQTGFFYNHIAFVLESDTEDPSFPGEPYNLKTSDTHDWRRLSLTPVAADGRNFHHSKLSDADNWYLPRFDTDAWGTWFTGWRVLNFTGKSYNSLSVDFDAKTVSSLMLRIGLWVVGGGVFLLGMVFLLARHLSRRLSRPIEALKGGAEAVMSQKYEHKVPVFGRDEFSRLTEVFNRMITWVGEMINLKAALSKMLSEELAESAAKDGLVLGGERVQCTIMFTDFAGFSSIAQGLKPEETVQLLNLYFGELIPIIKQQGGFPDKYIGDAIVAIFGAPIRLENHAEQAVKAAVKLQRRIRQINEERRAAGEVVFEMRVGLNSGEVLVGAIGCDMKLQYTAIGEAANMANRMEAVCPIGHVALSESTGRQVRESCLDALQVRVESVEEDLKGYDAPVSVRRVWVDDLEIVKPSSLEDTRRYYRYD